MSLSRLALAAFALMASLPFLVPLHTQPIPAFHAEWLATALGLAGGIALLGAPRLPLPGAALVALALAAVAAIQGLLGRALIPQLSVLFGLYLLWAAWLAAAANHLAAALGRAKVVRLLATAMLAGALMAAVLGAARPWLLSLGWTGYSLGGGGPLGQVNHLSVYLWLGVTSAFYLRATGRLSGPGFWAASAVLVLAAVLVGQRSSFLYAGVPAAVAAWLTRRGGGSAGGLWRAAGVGLLFVALQPLALISLPGGGGLRPPPAVRVAQEFAASPTRMQLLYVGLSGMAAAPLFGHGVGSYPSLAYRYADDILPADNPGPSEHAHNLLVDLGVELGLPAALLVALAAVLWFRRLPQRAAPAEVAWAATMMSMLAIHSLIEYPLWYAYFLGPAAVVAGAFGAERRSGGRLVPAALALGFLVAGAATLAGLKRDQARIEAALALGSVAEGRPLASALLLRVPPDSLLAPWVQSMACVSLDPLRVGVAEGLAVCRAGMAFMPTAESGVSLAVLLWRSGETAAAQDLLRRIERASQYQPGRIETLLMPLVAREAGLGALTGR